MAARTRYSGPAILLHWLMAGLVVANGAYGLAMGGSSGLAKFSMFQMHKSLGVLLLVLVLIRLAWRFGHAPPPAVGAAWERRLASVVHGALYGLLLLMPLLGWVAVSASPLSLPTLLFRGYGFPGLPWPHIPFLGGLPLPQKIAIEHAAETAHGVSAWVLAGLVTLHVVGALKHQFIDREPILARMAPGRS
ncbi:MAG: cytochrome b [Caulobacteraceae bacterium]